jgi:hypothetical protein
MTALAFLLAMLSFQYETCLHSMIEAAAVQRDEVRIPTLMLHVAASAIQCPTGIFVNACVKVLTRFHSPPDLRVTVEAFQATVQKVVARGAPEDAFQVGMSGRQRTRRNLRLCGTAGEKGQNRVRPNDRYAFEPIFHT